jgi:pimeloyl-ACP methyl ester carboxylesterase
MPSFRTQSGVELAFDEVGRLDGRPIVLLHGLTDDRRSYAPVVEDVAAGCRVIAVDLRGHGESSRAPRYRAVDYAADVAELVRARVSGPAVVVGHSLGGLTAACLAGTNPELVSGLFLEDPPLFEGDAARRAASPAASRFPALVARLREMHNQRLGVDAFAKLVGATPSPYGGTVAERTSPERLRIRGDAVMRCDLATIEAAISGDAWIDYEPTAPISAPVTVLRADPDFGAVFLPDNATGFAAAVPQAKIILVAGIGHTIHGDRDGLPQYLSALHAFLDQG